MVFVKVRETYDLKTVQNKMTVIGIHTPNPEIIKKNYPGLLMQCKAYRPYSCDVKVACASMLPVDPLGIGTEEGSIAPEDMFNPILYKAMSNKGMSQLEARIHYMINNAPGGVDVLGNSAAVEADTFTDQSNEFNIYYGLLSQTKEWKHANPQSGLQMTGLRPLVYDLVATQGDTSLLGVNESMVAPQSLVDHEGYRVGVNGTTVFLGKAKEMPFMNCTYYTLEKSKDIGYAQPGFVMNPMSCEVSVPWAQIMCGCIIVPPSKLHELYYRMVVEWTIEFTSIRPLSEITNFVGLGIIGGDTHYANYSYSKVKEVVGDTEDLMDNDTCMVSSNADIKKVM